MRCYRIVSPRHAATALSGEGARLYGGRWNQPGWRCVYAAETRALAVLELLVHLTGKSRGLTYRLLTVEVPDDAVVSPNAFPDGWNATPAGGASQSVGTEWLRTGKSAALRVPSVLIPEESNLLLNPDAEAFSETRIVTERDFQLDLRFAAKS